MNKKRLVSILTPTFNRRKFIPQYLKNIKQQDYTGNIEIIIVDDGTDNVLDLIPNDDCFKYIKLDSKKPIGYKRNLLCHEAKGDILINMDDDDYYPPERISHAVEKLNDGKDEALLAGSSFVFLFDKLNGITQLGPTNIQRGYHANGATFAFFKEYLIDNRYDDNAELGEEKMFTHHFTNPLIQLNPMMTTIVIGHKNNTVPKFNMGSKTVYNIEQFIKDKEACFFYKNVT